ncbi:MAG: hypothetical protein COA44_07820 [Arcobacter sp.]|nr:MAG: hypothetical protein COA44_07820 [Arcobacter sp.]
MIKALFLTLVLLQITVLAQSEFMKMCTNPTVSQYSTLQKMLHPDKKLKVTYERCQELERETVTRGGIILRRSSVSDLSPLRFFTNMDEVNLYEANISDITPLANLKKLEELDISFNPITDITPLKGLPLRILHINSNKPKVSASHKYDVIHLPVDLSPLSNITTLENLRIYGAGQLAPNLTKLVNLESLNLSGLDMKDLCTIKNSKKIKRLYLSSDDNLSSLNCIENLKELENLTIWGSQVTDLSPLTKLTKLKKIHLERVPITDISPLAKLKSLESLTFYKTNIKHLSPLKESKSLEYVMNENRHKFFTMHIFSGGLQSWAQTLSSRSLDYCSPIDIKEIRAGISCFEEDGALKPWWKRILRQ